MIPKHNARLITRLKWKFNNDANVQFCDSLCGTDWSLFFVGKSSSEQAVIFEEVLVSIAKKYHRLISVKQKFGQVSYPFFVTRAVRRRDRAFRKWKACLSGPHKERLRQKWKKYSRIADVKTRQYEQHHIMQAATATRDQKKFWKLVKATADVQSVPPLWCDNSDAFVFEDDKKADLLNTWFVSCQQSNTQMDTSLLDHSDSLPEPVSEQEVRAAIRQVLVPGKASGPFLLSTDLLRHCGSSVISPLIMLFNSCLLAGSFPDCWKTSYVTAIPKGSLDSTKLTNWRPISLLHPLSKVFEAVIARRLRLHLETNSLLSPHQYGFRQKRSTELLATMTTQQWQDALAGGYMVDAVFLDCQKAFDRADHQLIVQSLFHLGVSPVYLSFFADYLRGRQQITVVDGTNSRPLPVTSGVPQGSILGPLLFLCLINGVTSCQSPNTAIRIFADDIALYRIVRTPFDEAEFQSDLNNVFSWSSVVKLTFNSAKSVFVRFCGKRKVPEPPKYHLGGDEIPRKNSIKYLGLHLDYRLSWKDHVSNVVMKARKRIRYISFLFSRKCQRARLTLFKSLVVPLFDYCAVVCNPRLKGLVDDLEDCVRTFLRSINLGPALEDTSVGRYANRLRQLSMEPLILKRIKASLILAFKILFNLVPVSTPLFVPLGTVAAVHSVAGGTRGA